MRGRAHPNVQLLEAFYQAQAAFYAGGDRRALVLNPHSLEERLPWRSIRAALAALRKAPPATSQVGCVK